MRNATLIFLFIISIVMTNAQIRKPDFAFPKTVAKEAKADLLKAKDNGDAHKALNALIRLSVAESMVDPAKLQQLIKEAEQVSADFADSEQSGLFQAWLAYLYYSFYNMDRWKYNRRQIPLTPIPEDMTEWSGEQFRTKIQNLCTASIDTSGLKGLPISEYTDVISISPLASIYYTTLQDFAYQNAITILNDIALQDDAENVLNLAISSSAPGSAPYILWLWTLQNKSGNFSKSIEIVNPLMKNEYAGLLVWETGTMLDSSDLDDGREYIGIAEKYLKNFPSTPFKDNILNEIKRLKSENVTVSYPTLCAPGQNISLKVTNTNAALCHIDIYYTGEDDLTDGSRNIKNALRALTPKMTIDVKSNLTAPFREDTTLILYIDNPGYYYVLPRLESGKSDDAAYVQSMRCLGVYPLAVSNPDKSLIITLDPLSGAPIADASVWLRKNRSTEFVNGGKSDASGIADVTQIMSSGSFYNSRISVNGKKYTFPNLNLYRPNTSVPKDQYAADILTSRSIYHRGETVEALVLLSRAISRPEIQEITEVCANHKVRASLLDANYQRLTDTIAETDAYGRASIHFNLPTDVLTGNYSIEVALDENNNVLSASHFMVSDYKMPDFEVIIKEAACDVPSPGFVTINGSAVSYSGMPMGEAKATLNLAKTQWGWWRWHSSNSDNIYSAEAVTDADGTFSFVIPDSVLTDKNSLYSAAINVVSISGNAVEASTAFALTKKYQITLSGGGNIDGEKPYNPDVKVYSPDGSVTEIPLIWSVSKDNDTIATGAYTGDINLKNIRPATYTLTISPSDPSLADPIKTQIIVYNRASGIVPDDAVLYLPLAQYKSDSDGKVSIEYANSFDDTYIYYCVNGNTTSPMKLIKANGGYHTLCIEIPDGSQKATVYMYALKNCNLTAHTIEVNRGEQKTLHIVGESFRDGLTPGEAETWKIRITDNDGQPMHAALALDMYNKALEALAPHSFSITRPVLWYNRQVSSSYFKNYNRNISVRQSLSLSNDNNIVYPTFNLYGYALGGLVERDEMLYSVASSSRALGSNDIMIRGNAKQMKVESVADMSDAVTEETIAGTTEDVDSEESERYDYRDSNVTMAIWAPMLSTDNQGNILYSFTVPNANTTWRLRAVAWSKDMEIGTMMRDFVTSKPVMVQPNLPRFLRQGDSATVLASVMNNTDTVQTITTTVEIFDPLTQALKATKTFNQTIDAKQSEKVSVNIYVDNDATAIGFRVRSSNGTFSDGEQNVIRVLSSDASLIETTPFYLNPGDTIYTTTLPNADNANISLTFCENPAWTVVSALPGLRLQISEYANSAAAAMFSAAVSHGIIKDNPTIGKALEEWISNPSDSSLVSMLQKNEDLKIAVLNSTPWVQAAKSDSERMANLAMIFNDNDVNNTIAAAIKILTDLQNVDGGWSWSKWTDKSSVWVTANVLDMLGQLRDFGWMPAGTQLQDMIDRAIVYYDANVEKTDMMYCLVRPKFGTPVSANGQKVIKATIADIKKNWRKMTDPAYKSMAALALYLNGEKTNALKIMQSVSEFGVYSKNQGLTFPSVNSLYNYGILLEAYATILPQSKEVDGLRQQLIVRKQATDWGSSVVTTQVVKAILSTGTCWTVDERGTEVKVGGKEIKPDNGVEKATGSLRVDISEYGGDNLTIITSGAGPAYGAVYAQFRQRMDEVNANGCDDLDIEKQLFVRRGNEWAVADNLKVGDRVKVQLTIHCKRNMQYVEIVDERPAAFEPVEQLPGWMWSEGVGFYRENLDAQTNMHVVYMTPGTYLLTYEMNVNLAGDFTSGVASIQSQYAPELSAHSSGSQLKVE